MRKFWNSLTPESATVEETQDRNFEIGGVDNDAFSAEDFDLTYARWKNLEIIGELEEQILDNTKDNVESQDPEHGKCSKHSDDTTNENYEELDNTNILMKRPSSSVSRSSLTRKLFDEYGKLGTMCMEADCPYNLWLFKEKEFPEEQSVEDWEVKKKLHQKEKYELDHENDSLPRVVTNKPSSRRKSKLSHFDQHSFKTNAFYSHYERNPYPFAFPNPTSSMYLPSISRSDSSGPPTPSTAPLPPYPWHLYNNSPINLSMTSNYPIVTLPRSERRGQKSSRVQKLNRPASKDSVLYMKKKYANQAPSSSSSCSCTSSSCSSCSSCVDIPMELRPPSYTFATHDTKLRLHRRKRCPCLPRCDFTCCVLTSFILITLAGLAAMFFYLYLFTSVEDKAENM